MQFACKYVIIHRRIFDFYLWLENEGLGCFNSARFEVIHRAYLALYVNEGGVKKMVTEYDYSTTSHKDLYVQLYVLNLAGGSIQDHIQSWMQKVKKADPNFNKHELTDETFDRWKGSKAQHLDLISQKVNSFKYPNQSTRECQVVCFFIYFVFYLGRLPNLL